MNQINGTFNYTNQYGTRTISNIKTDYVPALTVFGDHGEKEAQAAKWTAAYDDAESLNGNVRRVFDSEEALNEWLKGLERIDAAQVPTAIKTPVSYEPAGQAIELLNKLTPAQFEKWNERELYKQDHDFEPTVQIWDDEE